MKYISIFRCIFIFLFYTQSNTQTFHSKNKQTNKKRENKTKKNFMKKKCMLKLSNPFLSFVSIIPALMNSFVLSNVI